MKRLLACLFLIIGLGLVFSVNAKAKSVCVLIMDPDEHGFDGIVAHRIATSGKTKIDKNKSACENYWMGNDKIYARVFIFIFVII